MMQYKDITVVIPTINEEGSIGTLIKRLLTLYNGIRIAVIDDGSSDGTLQIAKAFSRKEENVHVYDRKALGLKKGLEYSMIDGMRFSKTRYVVFIDGDLQHPPEGIKRIAAELSKGSSIAIAVRAYGYNTLLHRTIISSVLSAIGIMVLRMQGSATSRDIFSGYFGVEKSYAEKILKHNKKRFVGEGYKFLFDLLKCIPTGETTMAEIPYRFKERQFGSSKAAVSQGIALLRSYFT